MDSLVRSLGTYILDDLDECSSVTETYVERRRPAPPQPKKEPSMSREPAKRSASNTRTSRTMHTNRTTSRTEPTNTAVGTFVNSSFTLDGRRLLGNMTTANAHTTKEKTIGQSVGNEKPAHRSTFTAPAAPGREPSRRSKPTSSENVGKTRAELGSTRRESFKEDKRESLRKDKSDRDQEGQPSAERTSPIKHVSGGATHNRSVSEGKSQEKLHASRLEVETKVDKSLFVTNNNGNTEELLKENRALRKRVERLEKDVLTNRKLAEHYKEKRDRERLRAEERCRELETVVDNMRESYEQELEDVREQLAKCAADAAEKVKAAERMQADAEAAVNSAIPQVQQQSSQAKVESRASSVYGPSVREPSVREPSVRGPSMRGHSVKPTSSVREPRAPSREPTVRASSPRTVKEEKHSVHELSIQTDPVLSRLPHHRATNSFQSQSHQAPGTDASKEISALVTKLEQREAELSALKLFHEEVPQVSLVELSTSVNMLNAEIGALSATVASSIPLGRPWEAAQAWALEAADPALERCLRLLAGVKGADFARDPTLVRLALQSWLVICLQRVFDKFLFGLDDSEDVSLKRLYEQVQSHEALPVASRWRRLTRRHARVLVPSAFKSSPSTADFTAARDHIVHLLEMDILVGFESLLRFAGAHSPPGVLLEELSKEFGSRISLAVKRTARLATDLAERAPAGCEVFTAAFGDDSSKDGENKGENCQGAMLCGCMENIDSECRRWVGRKRGSKASRGTRAGTRTGTMRSRSRISRGRTATTWADTNIRQWDQDDSDEEIETDSEEEEDEFEEGVEPGTHDHASVVCALGFGLRRVYKSGKQTHAAEHSAISGVDQPEELQWERKRRMQAEVETVRSTSYSISQSISSPDSTTSTPLASVRTDRPRNPHTSALVETGTETRSAELLVKADVLMSSTVEHLQNRFTA